MKIKAMGYPARNYNFDTEKEIRSLSSGGELRGLFGSTKNNTAKKMYGTGKVFGKSTKIGAFRSTGKLKASGRKISGGRGHG